MLVDLKIVDLKIIDLKIIDLNTSSIFNGFIKSFPDKAGLFFKAVLHLLILWKKQNIYSRFLNTNTPSVITTSKQQKKQAWKKCERRKEPFK